MTHDIRSHVQKNLGSWSTNVFSIFVNIAKWNTNHLIILTSGQRFNLKGPYQNDIILECLDLWFHFKIFRRYGWARWVVSPTETTSSTKQSLKLVLPNADSEWCVTNEAQKSINFMQILSQRRRGLAVY